MKSPPALSITAPAKAALLQSINDTTGHRQIATVVWWHSGADLKVGSNGNVELESVAAHWGVGYYSAERVPPSELCEIEGILFVFESDILPRLNGATLDYSGGRFVVIEHMA